MKCARFAKGLVCDQVCRTATVIQVGPGVSRLARLASETSPELLLGFHKTKASKKGVTYQEALDSALAFWWIDGVRKGLDDALHDPIYAAKAEEHLERREHQACRRADGSVTNARRGASGRSPNAKRSGLGSTRMSAPLSH